MTRRYFFLTGAAAMSSAAASRIRIAFLGAGHGHGISKLDLVQQSADWELVGVHEPDPGVLAKCTAKGVPSLALPQILEDKTISVIAVESFVPELAGFAKAALEAGKHVHLDKPPATNMEDLRTILALAQRKQLLVQMGYMWRYHPAINAALEAARKGWLGDIYLVRAQINTMIDAPERRKLAKFKGGQMFELGGHVIDPVAWLMGRPEKVTPFLRHDGLEPDGLADNTMAVLEWRKAMGTVSTVSMHPRGTTYRTFELVGTGGTVVVRPIEPPSMQVDLNTAAGPYKAGPQTLSFTYRRYVDDFIDLAAAVRGERKLKITPQEELLVEETLLRASGMLAT